MSTQQHSIGDGQSCYLCFCMHPWRMHSGELHEKLMHLYEHRLLFLECCCNGCVHKLVCCAQIADGHALACHLLVAPACMLHRCVVHLQHKPPYHADSAGIVKIDTAFGRAQTFSEAQAC